MELIKEWNKRKKAMEIEYEIKDYHLTIDLKAIIQ